MPTPTPSDETTAAHGQEPAMGTQQPEPQPEAGVPVTEVGKADGSDGKPPMVAVYDAKGKLVGIVDPSEITPISGADAGDDGAGDDAPAAEAAPETTDLTPAPAGEVGTPADAPADGGDDGVTKSDESDTTSEEVLKSSFLAAVEQVFKTHSATQAEAIAATGDAVLELAGMVETLKGRIGVLEEQPAEPKVFTNGAVPPRDQLRGQDKGAAPVDVAKAREMKQGLYRSADAREQNRIAQEMQAGAIDALQAIHRRR